MQARGRRSPLLCLPPPLTALARRPAEATAAAACQASLPVPGRRLLRTSTVAGNSQGGRDCSLYGGPAMGSVCGCGDDVGGDIGRGHRVRALASESGGPRVGAAPTVVGHAPHGCRRRRLVAMVVGARAVGCGR